jgi:hypothetical protein
MEDDMATRWKYGSRHRDYLHSEARADAYLAGRGEHPICNLCDQPITPDQDWDESHDPGQPRCFGGKSKALAHVACNREHGAKVVTPAFAKAERVRKRHLGITGPGLGRHPMRCGRRSRERKTMNHGVQPRLSVKQKHAAYLARRFFFLRDDGDGAQT